MKDWSVFFTQVNSQNIIDVLHYRCKMTCAQFHGRDSSEASLLLQCTFVRTNSHYGEYRASVKCIVFYWVDMVVSIQSEITTPGMTDHHAYDCYCDREATEADDQLKFEDSSYQKGEDIPWF